MFHTLFKKDHAMLKDPRSSELWTAKLVVAQRQIRGDRGVLGADVNEVIRTFSVAPQRFRVFLHSAGRLLAGLACHRQDAEDDRG